MSPMTWACGSGALDAIAVLGVKLDPELAVEATALRASSGEAIERELWTR